MDRKKQGLIKAGVGIAIQDKKMASEGLDEFIAMRLLEDRMDEAEFDPVYIWDYYEQEVGAVNE